MDKKIEEYCRNCISAFLIISLFISPLTAGAGQISSQDEQSIPKTAKEKLQTRVTINSTDTPIEKVLMDLADQAKIDIIKSPKVTGDITVKVTGVPLEEALTNILAVYNCTYIATENMVRVVPLPEMGADVKEPQITRIYKITYADVEAVHTALDKFKSGKGEVGINKGTSHIIVTDTDDKIKVMDKFIEQVDRITSQVLVEVRIYDVSTKEGFELSPDWHLGRNAPYTGETFLMPDEIQTIETGPESSYYKQKRTDMRWWTPTSYPDPAWVGVGLPEGSDLAAVDERTEEQWTQEPGGTEIERTYYDPPAMVTNRRRKPFVGGSFDRITGGTLSFSVLNNAIDLNFVLSVLHSQIDARLLANPRILVLDNETAEFEIVREFPYRELLQVTREDPMSYTDFKEVGVDLKVTPHIARDGMLRLHIEPKFSVLVGREALSVLKGTDDFGNMAYVSVLGVPIIDARRLETTAMIKDGQTIAIGGLRKREVTKDIAKVPVLGDLPLVGGLFTSETESVAINELVVFITATIVTEPTLSESEKKLFDETKFTTPQLEKTRIEKGEFEKAKVEKAKVEKAEVEKLDIAETLDLLLQKLGPSGR